MISVVTATYNTPAPILSRTWTLNEETTEWEAPVARPEEGMWAWDEDEQVWNEIVLPSGE
jgi:hypothetical protein